MVKTSLYSGTRRDVEQGQQVLLKRTFNLGQLAYVAPISLEDQDFNVLVSTGSSDLWFASDRCDSSSCEEKEGFEVHLLQDNIGLDEGLEANLNNLLGTAQGEIVSSNTSFADSAITNQAFLRADDVEGVQLGPMQATGILGLGPPVGSLVQSIMGTQDSGQNNSMTDPSRTASILPGLLAKSPTGQRFFSIGLQRLPSDGGNGNSTLTFGDFDREYMPLSSQKQMKWSSILAGSDGLTRAWKLIVNDFQLTVNDSKVQIPLSTTGSAVVTAILDSGSPLNYASSSFLNAMYGAYNLGPAADGSGEYYVDCGLQILMTINVGGIAVPVHPLDASLKYNNIPGSGDSGCIGSFQSFPQGKSSGTVGAQLVLGAPFLRSVYSTFSCDAHPANSSSNGWCSNPSVGIYPLYQQSEQQQAAIDEFQRVRVQGQKLGDNSIIDGSGASGKKFNSGAKIAVGVVCGLVGLVIVMVALLLLLKRRRKKMNLDEDALNELSSPDDLEEKDPITGSVNWKKLSERERQKARELAMLHGHFVEEQEPSRSGTPTAPPGDDWDVTSKGYWEARAIVNEYRRREREHDLHSSTAAKSLSGSATSHHDSCTSEPLELRDTTYLDKDLPRRPENQ